ncbi:hypothetical protein Tco_0221362 [Tanacetum coccineum]
MIDDTKITNTLPPMEWVRESPCRVRSSLPPMEWVGESPCGVAPYLPLVEWVGDLSCKILFLFTPYGMGRGLPLSLDLNKTQSASTPGEVKRMRNVSYASAVGPIMYAVRCTRPDVAFTQNITSHFQQNTGEPHWTAVKTILKYLRNTKDMFLFYGRNPEAELRVDCYFNAGFETDRDEIKSQT